MQCKAEQHSNSLSAKIKTFYFICAASIRVALGAERLTSY